MNLDQQIAEDLERIEEGYRDALPVIVKWRRMQKLLDEAINQIKEKAIDELSNYPKSTAEINGAKLEVRATAGRWNYKDISQWAELDAQRKQIEEKAKQAYNLKMKGIEAFDEETGELIESADYTPGKDTIFISI
jgi:hypothetical protein